MEPIIFNVISGKGGTGKTLLTAVLADALGRAGAKVLVVDLDIFVRGLTTMLYHQREGISRIIAIEDGRLSTSDIFYSVNTQTKSSNNSAVKPPDLSKDLYIDTYPGRSFLISPAVGHIRQTYPFHDVMPDSIGDAVKIITHILDKAKKQLLSDSLDYIFLDSRAGYDEVVSAAYLLSDYSICVDEDDKVSLITASNLIDQLNSLKSDTALFSKIGINIGSEKTIFRIRNKAHQYDPTNPRKGFENDTTFLGIITFDGDVRACFGTDSFWNVITRNLYTDGLCKAWNFLIKSEGIHGAKYYLNYSFTSSIGSKRTEQNLSILPTSSRLGYISGFALLILGAILISLNSDFWKSLFVGNTFIIIGSIAIILGMYKLFSSVSKANRRKTVEPNQQEFGNSSSK